MTTGLEQLARMTTSALSGGSTVNAQPIGTPQPAPAPAPKYLTRDQLDTYLNANYGELSDAFSKVGSQYGFTNLNDFANSQYVNHGWNEIQAGQRANPFATPSPAPAPTPAPAAAPAPPPVTNYAGLIADALKAAGVTNQAQAPAPAPPPVTQAPKVTYTPTMGTVNQSTDTAAGQIQRLISEGSPVLDRARSLAEQRANGRGLINTSIAAGAGTAALLDTATNIGANDAGVYSQQRIANQDAANQMELARGNSDTQVNLANARAANDFAMAGYDDLLQRGRLGLVNQYENARAAFDAGVGEMKDYRTADLQDRNDARAGDRALINQSKLNEQNFGFERTLGAETDLRREGIASRARGEEQQFATSEREAGQQFAAGENRAGREFQASENQANRAFQTQERVAGQGFTADENRINREFTAEQNRLMREAQTVATSKGLTGDIARQAAMDVSRILSDPNIDQENKQALIDKTWANARTAQGVVDGVNGTSFADIFPAGPAPAPAPAPAAAPAPAPRQAEGGA